MRLLVFTVLAAAMALTGCSSNKVKNTNTELTKDSQYRDGRIGIDKDDRVIIQEEQRLENELRKIAWDNYGKLQDIESRHNLLHRCRADIADPRLGGSGEMVEIPELDTLNSVEQWREEIAINQDGQLRVVKREDYKQRLENERKYNDQLRSQLKIVRKHLRKCERQMGHARVRAGLPAQRYKAKGRYQNGIYKMEREAEQTLDDAFRIRSKESAKAGGELTETVVN